MSDSDDGFGSLFKVIDNPHLEAPCSFARTKYFDEDDSIEIPKDLTK